MPLEASEEICEALVRHVETTGSEVFEKFFIKNGRIVCAVYCVVGPNAEEFREGVQAWMRENGYNPDEEDHGPGNIAE
jgi:hypothetical protein